MDPCSVERVLNGLPGLGPSYAGTRDLWLGSSPSPLNPSMKALQLLFLFAGLGLAACRSVDPGLSGRMDPTVVIDGASGRELGVSTDYGVVFLGTTQQSGEVDFTAWFLDGPSLETGLIEPLGSELFLTQAEIELPETPVTFQIPERGTPVVVAGRRNGKSFQIGTQIATDPSVEGLLLRSNGALARLGKEQLGAGVYVEIDRKWMLLGLLSGSLELQSEGQSRSYHTLAGPARLWRLAAATRDRDQPKPLPKRGDIL